MSYMWKQLISGSPLAVRLRGFVFGELSAAYRGAPAQSEDVRSESARLMQTCLTCV